MMRSRCFTPLALVALAAGGEPTNAQDAAPQRVEIVGSHLKRTDHEGPAPVSTYTSDDIQASGAARLGDFLLALPYAGAGGFDDRSTVFSGGLEGSAALSLRGLGPGATLVLLNGPSAPRTPAVSVRVTPVERHDAAERVMHGVVVA